jgi:O-methyltransferase involved in polyketide biosynthesis
MNGESVCELDDVAETLLIPLAARALAPRLNPDLGFRDPVAEDVFARLDTSPEKFAGDRMSMRGSIVRTGWFDSVASAFFERHPQGLCLSLGSGLDGRAGRIGLERFPHASWIDLDRAAVTALRQKLLPASANALNATANFEDLHWIDGVDWAMERPVLVLAEGVLMYLEPADAEQLIRTVGERAQQKRAVVELAFDFASPWMVRNSRRHPSVKKTRAVFRWALKRPSDLLTIDPALNVTDVHDVTARSGFAPALMSHVHRLLTGGEIYACLHLKRLLVS